MKREILDHSNKARAARCCPGHDHYPSESYSTRTSKHARSRMKQREHRHARARVKRQIARQLQEAD